jgi:hypothetical protein
MLKYKKDVQTGHEKKLYFKSKPEDQWKEIPRSEWCYYWESEAKIMKMNWEAAVNELEEVSIENNALKGRIMQLEAEIALKERKVANRDKV